MYDRVKSHQVRQRREKYKEHKTKETYSSVDDFLDCQGGKDDNISMDLEEKKYWVLFNILEGIGPLRFKLLLDYFGSAKDAFNASQESLQEIGLGEKLIAKFLNFRNSKFDIDSYFLRLEKLKIKVLCYEEENYPKLLKEIVDKPPVIYVKYENDLGVFAKKAVAVVGTRKATGYGRQVTEMITEGLVASGLVVVSGLARGVDKIAHQTTINSNGLTIAVLGCGLDLVYPPEHKDLAGKIVELGGALVSEYPLGTPAVPGNFPARNRIISGLSLGVVVTEAAEDSGSLITASCAAEQGREVFAVPGPITSPLSAGTSALIKKGAKVVSSVEDIFEELGIRQTGGKNKGQLDKTELDEVERKIVDLLENENLHIDEIARRLEVESGAVGGRLSLLEIKGIIRNFGEGVYGLR
ncbi:MAG: DNA-processing protein DprA [Microgenomates group bacterium]